MDAHIYKNKIAKSTNSNTKILNDISSLMRKVFTAIKTKIKEINEKEIRLQENPANNYLLGLRKDA